MKKISISKSLTPIADDMRPEYHFDYRKSRPNRFVTQSKDRLIVVLDPDVSKVFKTKEAVNTALRAVISAIPLTTKRKVAVK